MTDAGTPSLSATDASDAVFTIARAGGDITGPVVVAGSIHASPNPIQNSAPATISATVSDALTGGAAVAAAEWSYGETPASAGQGNPMTGTFGTPSVIVTAVLSTDTLATGLHGLWVRGRDALGNWGAPGSLQVRVNDTQTETLGGELTADVLEDGISLEWVLADRSRVARWELQRATSELGPWLAIDATAVDLGGATVVVDRNVEAGTTYFYRLLATARDSSQTILGPVKGAVGRPNRIELGVARPNPAASRSLISFALPARGDVDLAIFDVTGRRVRSLVTGSQAAGVHESAWDLRDDAGALVRAGVYYYRLDVAGRAFTRRLIALN